MVSQEMASFESVLANITDITVTGCIHGDVLVKRLLYAELLRVFRAPQLLPIEMNISDGGCQFAL